VYAADDEDAPLGDDVPLPLAASAVALFATALILLIGSLDNGGDTLDLDDLEAYSGAGSSALPSAGSVTSAVLWSVSLFFASPVQVLLLFLGKTDTERPSDATATWLGQLFKLDVDSDEYEAPVWLLALNALIFCILGVGVAYTLESSLGESTWGVSSGIGFAALSGVYELGRPERLTAVEVVEREERYQAFLSFADARLSRSGRAHRSEIEKAFRRYNAAMGRQVIVDEQELKAFIRSFHPTCRPQKSGFYKNLSLLKEEEVRARAKQAEEKEMAAGDAQL